MKGPCNLDQSSASQSVCGWQEVQSCNGRGGVGGCDLVIRSVLSVIHLVELRRLLPLITQALPDGHVCCCFLFPGSTGSLLWTIWIRKGFKVNWDACEFCSRLVDHSALIMLVVGMLVSCLIGLWNGTTRGWNCLLYFSSTLLQLNNWCSVSYVSFSVQVSFLDDDDVLMLAALYHHYGVLFRRCWTQSLINVNVFIDIPLVIERKRTAKWLASYKSNAVRNHESILSYFLPCLVFQY
jgi:hypothetical protein